jgi:hemoglobin
MRPVGSDVKMLEPRVDITPHEIAQVVAAFYGRVRQHPVLGPIFFSILSRDASIWRAHEEKITEFWCNAILHKSSYSGNPMLVHSGISALQPHHFAIWLELFDQTLTHVLKHFAFDLNRKGIPKARFV